MEAKGGGAVWGCLVGFKGCQPAVSNVLPGIPRTSLTFAKAPGAIGEGESHRVCPGDQGLGSGETQLRGRSLTCSPDWCGLYLDLWSLQELWGRAGYGEDEEEGEVGWYSGC